VVFTTQAGGLGCCHPEVEGVFVPLFEDHGRVSMSLMQRFRGDWHPISEEDATMIDRLLKNNGLEFIRVDRSRLSESFEAWVHVSVEEPTSEIRLISGFGSARGVLTWSNSD
jgi:hypothetical protein